MGFSGVIAPTLVKSIVRVPAFIPLKYCMYVQTCLVSIDSYAFITFHPKTTKYTPTRKTTTHLTIFLFHMLNQLLVILCSPKNLSDESKVDFRFIARAIKMLPPISADNLHPFHRLGCLPIILLERNHGLEGPCRLNFNSQDQILLLSLIYFVKMRTHPQIYTILEAERMLGVSCSNYPICNLSF